MPQHTIYGLTIDCDIALPELPQSPALGRADLTICRGDVRAAPAREPAALCDILDGNPDDLWLRIPGVLCMAVRNGNALTYAPETGASEDEVRLFLLGSGMGAIMMQRGFVVAHGNAIALGNEGGAVVCIGDSGAGKSTTAVAMMQRGYAILADDVCPIGADGLLQPGMPRAKLWDDAAQRLGIATAPLKRVRDQDEKFNLPLGERYCTTAQRIAAFVWLVPQETDTVECTQVHGVERFTVLRNNIYRPEYLGPLGLEGEYLQRVAEIAGRTPIFKLTRPKTGFALDPVLDTIISTTEALRIQV